MKVLYINSVYKYGSTGKIVEQLHFHSLQNGIESFVCYGRGVKIKDKNVFKVSNEFLSKINQIRARLTGMIYGGNFFATLKLINVIKKIKPDIVHIHNLNDQYVNEYKLLGFLANKKIHTIVTLHSEQMYTATCGYSLECNAWKEKGCTKCPHIYVSTVSKIDKTKKAFKKLERIYNMFDTDYLIFISCTPWLKKRAKQSLLCSRFNNFVVLNGADESIYRNFSSKEIAKLKKEFNFDSNKKIVLNVNPRIADPIKGHSFFYSIDRKFIKQYQIVVVGKVPDNIPKVEGITYLGEIRDPTKLVELYNCADYSIMFSKKECFPMVIVESLLCGTPVSLYKCDGPDDCYEDAFVKFSDYGNFNQVFNNLSNFRCSREDVRNYSINRLSSFKMCSDYIKIYKNLMGEWNDIKKE